LPDSSTGRIDKLQARFKKLIRNEASDHFTFPRAVIIRGGCFDVTFILRIVLTGKKLLAWILAPETEMSLLRA
jgi:hypothetical protein